MLTESRMYPDGSVRTISKVDIAVRRIQETYRMFAKSGRPGSDRPAWVAFSGGKDSTVLLDLVRRSGIPFEAHYNVTSVDPPELVALIKRTPDVIMNIPRYSDGTPITMWNLIPKKTFPPTRVARYCCAALKESAGSGHLVLTGVRWAESPRRRNSWGVVNIHGKRNIRKAKELEIAITETGRDRAAFDPLEGCIDDYSDPDESTVMLNNDNGKLRRMMEYCVGRGKTSLNPIIDWSDEDVWEYIENEKLPYCSLYTQAGGDHTRLGCIGCPMNSKLKTELDSYPKYKAAYLRAFDQMMQVRKMKNLETTLWKTADDVMEWWVSN